MTNGEARVAEPITSPNCASYLRRWNPAIKNCCCTWPKRSQEASPNRPATFIQQPQVRRLLTRVSGFPRTALSSYCALLNCASRCIHEISYIACKHLQTKVAISRSLVDLRLLASFLLVETFMGRLNLWLRECRPTPDSGRTTETQNQRESV